MLIASHVRVSVPRTCNSVVFSQLPTDRDHFIGRIGKNGGTCADVNPKSLALFQMNWGASTLHFERYILTPPLEIAAKGETYRASNLYDPSVAFDSGELWVAFECAVDGLVGASTCIGPFDFEHGQIDAKRVSLLVKSGDADPESPYSYAASVPNLVLFKGRLYVYWSAIKIEKATRKWEIITIRGMELVKDPSEAARLWGAGSVGRPVASHDPSRNMEIVGIDSADPYSNQTADLKGAFAAQNSVYLFVSVGGKGPDGTQSCTTPKGTSPGCFRLEVLRSSVPLGTNSFIERLVSPAPPLNPADYQRALFAPDGTLKVIGEFFGLSSQAGLSGVAELIMYPFNLGSLRFSARSPFPALRAD
jgi:hypothetical protein